MTASAPQVLDQRAIAGRLLRFDRVQRGAHWANAVLFGVLITTALPLYFGSLAGVVLRRHVVAEIHLWAGIALPLPIIVSLLGPWGTRMRTDLRRMNLWTRDEIYWLRRRGRTSVPLDKFNPGQKLNAVFTAATILVMLASGSVMQWFRFFPVSWRTGATFVHDVFAFSVVLVVVAHISIALTHRDAMRSMVRGWVTESWASRHAARWLDEERLGGGRRSGG